LGSFYVLSNIGPAKMSCKVKENSDDRELSGNIYLAAKTNKESRMQKRRMQNK